MMCAVYVAGIVNFVSLTLSRFPPTAQELARDEAEFRSGLKKMTERERSELYGYLFTVQFLSFILVCGSSLFKM